MSVLAGLFAQAEAGEQAAAAAEGEAEASAAKRAPQTYRFSVALDPEQTQVISFTELVAQQRAAAGTLLEGGASRSAASEPDSDKGSCYDSEDSFLDDQELVEELEPSHMKSKIDGFFINTGSMDAEEDPSYGGNGAGGHFGSSKKSKKKAQPEPSRKRPKLSPGPGGPVLAQAANGGGGRSSTSPQGTLSGTSPTGESRASHGGASPEGGGGKPKKAKKGPPPPRVHDGIAARIEDLRRVVDSSESLQAEGVLDPKTLPEWLEKPVKKVERALRLFIPKQGEWDNVRKNVGKHLKEILPPWKLTDAQLRRLGDNDANDDALFAKDLEGDLCSTLKEAANKQLKERPDDDDEEEETSPVSDKAEEGGDGGKEGAEGDGKRKKKRARKEVEGFNYDDRDAAVQTSVSFVWEAAQIARYTECVELMYDSHVCTHGKSAKTQKEFQKVVGKFHSRLAKQMPKVMHECKVPQMEMSLKREGATEVPAIMKEFHADQVQRLEQDKRRAKAEAAKRKEAEAKRREEVRKENELRKQERQARARAAAAEQESFRAAAAAAKAQAAAVAQAKAAAAAAAAAAASPQLPAAAGGAVGAGAPGQAGAVAGQIHRPTAVHAPTTGAPSQPQSQQARSKEEQLALAIAAAAKGRQDAATAAAAAAAATQASTPGALAATAAVAAAAGVPKPSAISLLPSAGAAAPKPARKKKEAWQLELLTAAYAISKDTPTGADLEQLATQTCDPAASSRALAKVC